MPLCAHNCGGGGLFVTPIEVCMHPSAFLSMTRKPYSWWLLYEELLFEFGRVGVHQLQNTLCSFFIVSLALRPIRRVVETSTSLSFLVALDSYLLV